MDTFTTDLQQIIAPPLIRTVWHEEDMAKEDLVSYAVTVVRIMTRSFFDFHLSGFAFPAPGEFLEFLVGVCRPVLQILTRFQTKKCNFPHPFSDQTSKIHTCFQTRD